MLAYMLRARLGRCQSRVLPDSVCGVFRYLKQNVQEFQQGQHAISGMVNVCRLKSVAHSL